MAAEKTTKKVTSKKVVKTTNNDKTLVEQLADMRKELFEAKKSHKAGELVNPRVLKEHRKGVARLMTKVNLKESK